jgi:two-component system, NtrC family, response regulator HydG
MQTPIVHDDTDWFGVDVEDLSARLRFNPKDAHIWLEGERMILMHVAAFARLRHA